MAQFIAFTKNAEINGETVLSVVNAMKGFETFALEILKENGIDNPQVGEWYSQQGWLDAFKVIAEKMGATTLFNIGKAIPENAQFPPGIDTLEKALSLIHVAYHMNHRIDGVVLFNPETGVMKEGIGYYKLVDFNNEKRCATFECKNPYPSHFDRGVITTFARKFKPEDSDSITVELDETKESRLKGGDSCTYIIKW